MFSPSRQGILSPDSAQSEPSGLTSESANSLFTEQLSAEIYPAFSSPWPVLHVRNPGKRARLIPIMPAGRIEGLNLRRRFLAYRSDDRTVASAGLLQFYERAGEMERTDLVWGDCKHRLWASNHRLCSIYRSTFLSTFLPIVSVRGSRVWSSSIDCYLWARLLLLSCPLWACPLPVLMESESSCSFKSKGYPISSASCLCSSSYLHELRCRV